VNSSESAKLRLRRKLTQNEIEEICEAAENAARSALFTKVNPKQVSDFEIAMEATCDKPLTLTVDISVFSSFPTDGLSRLIDEACDNALKAAEQKAKELGVV
jgi:hypothetical protein